MGGGKSKELTFTLGEDIYYSSTYVPNGSRRQSVEEKHNEHAQLEAQQSGVIVKCHRKDVYDIKLDNSEILENISTGHLKHKLKPIDWELKYEDEPVIIKDQKEDEFVMVKNEDGVTFKEAARYDSEQRKSILKTVHDIRRTWSTCFGGLSLLETLVQPLETRIFIELNLPPHYQSLIEDFRLDVRKINEREFFEIPITYGACIKLYTMNLPYNNPVYRQVNKSLRDFSHTTSLEFPTYSKSLLRALRHLPYCMAKTTEIVIGWRGMKTKMVCGKEHKWTADDYPVGELITWKAFTSFSKQRDTAEKYAGPDGVLLNMQIETGRSIDKFSEFPEEEVLLPPMTVAQVLSTEMIGEQLIVNLKEVHILKGEQFVLFVDDMHQQNCPLIAEVEKNTDVSFGLVRTTEEALAFMRHEENHEIRNKKVDSFRIVTDMYRTTEKEEEKVSAGAILIRKLHEFGYDQKVMVFVRDTEKAKLELENKNIDVERHCVLTSNYQLCVDFCSFKDIEYEKIKHH